MIYIIIFFINITFADQRNFVWTYEKVMLDPGESEIELYYTNELPYFDISDQRNVNNNTLKLEAEIEIGMSENLEVGFYSVFKESSLNGGNNNSREFYFDQFKLRFKYVVFKNRHSWSPLFYSEIKSNNDFLDL